MKTSLSTLLLIAIATGAFFSLHTTTYAQSEAEPMLISEEGAGDEALIRIPDIAISIKDAAVLQVTDTCGGFENTSCNYVETTVILVNEGITPRTVSYGLLLSNTEKENVSYLTPPFGDLKLYPGEAQTLTKRIPLPAFLGEGLYSATVFVAEKSLGTMLETKQAGFMALEKSTTYRISGCTLNGNAVARGETIPLTLGGSIGTLSCAVAASTGESTYFVPRLYAQIAESGALGDVVVSESVQANQDGKTKTEMNISPEKMSAITSGKYTLSIFLGDDSGDGVLTEPITLGVVVDGPYARFAALDVDKASYMKSDVAHVITRVQSRTLGQNAKVVVTLSDNSGVCGKGEAPLTLVGAMDIPVSIERDCTLALVSADVVVGDGTVVANEKLDWAPPVRGIPGNEMVEGTPTETAETGGMSLTTVMFAFFAVMLLVLLYVLLIQKRKLPPEVTMGILLMVLGGILPFIPNEASADWAGGSGFVWQAGCPMTDLWPPEGEGWADVSFDKASYLPGETVNVTAVISGELNTGFDAGIGGIVYWLVGDVTGPAGTVWGVPPVPSGEKNGAWNYTTGTWDGDGWIGQPTRTFNYSFTAPATEGTYSFTGSFYYRPDGNPDNPIGPCGQWAFWEYENVTIPAFTVTATPPPPPAPPIANFTVNGSHNVTVEVGDSLYYAWNGSGGPRTSWGSNYTVTGNCPAGTAPGVAGASNDSGSTNSTADASQAGCTYTFVYTVSGPGGTDSDTITVKINASGPAPSCTISASPNPCTLSGGVCTSYITWTTQNMSNPAVFIQESGSLFAAAPNFTNAEVSWITASPVTFIIRENTGFSPPPPVLCSVTVQGQSSGGYACTGSIPANSSAWDAEESSGLSANTPWAYGDPDGASKCQYHCDATYVWNGSSCVPGGGPLTCSGSIPPNAIMHPGDDTGLATPETWHYEDPDTAVKCEFYCGSGFSWNGGQCVTTGYPDVYTMIRASAQTCVAPSCTWPLSALPSSVTIASGGNTDIIGAAINGVEGDMYLYRNPIGPACDPTINGSAASPCVANNGTRISPNAPAPHWCNYAPSGCSTGYDLYTLNTGPLFTNTTYRFCADHVYPSGGNWSCSDFTVNVPVVVSAPTCSLTFNGSSANQFGVDPLLPRTWAWGSSNGNTYTLTASVTNCEDPTQNTPGTIAWQPWTNGGTGSIAGGTNVATPGATRYGCVGTNIYTVANSAGTSITCDITVGFKTSSVAVNQPPIVNAGPDVPVTLPTNTASPNGASATDPDVGGSIASLAWTYRSGPTLPTFTNGTTLNPTFGNLAAGVYVFRLTATDNLGATAFDEMRVIVGAGGGTNPTCSLTFNGSSADQLNIDPLLPRTWAWTSTNGVNPYLLTANVTNCDDPTQNTSGTVAWQPWTNGGTGDITGGSNGPTVPGALRAGCRSTNVYRVTNNLGISTTCDINIGFRSALGGPNLTSENLTHTTGLLEEGQTVRFSSDVSNSGTVDIAGGFSDNFTYRWSFFDSWTPLNTIPEAALTVGSVRTDNSANLPLTRQGSLQVQHCVDSNMVNAYGQIDEGTNEDDNCQQEIFVVGPAGGGGGCTPTTIGHCELEATPDGGSSGSCEKIGYVGTCNYRCNSTTWNINTNTCVKGGINATSPVSAGSPSMVDWNSTFASACAVMSPQSGVVPAGWNTTSQLLPIASNALTQNPTKFILSCRGTLAPPMSDLLPVDEVDVTVNTGPDLTSDEKVVEPNVPFNLFWDTNNGNESLCSLTGGKIPVGYSLSAPPSPERGSVNTSITTRTTFTLSCPNSVPGNPALTDTVTVDIKPTSYEE